MKKIFFTVMRATMAALLEIEKHFIAKCICLNIK